MWCLLFWHFQLVKKRKYPKLKMGEPVFMIETKVNGSDVNVTAGKDQYYMFTSHSIDEWELMCLMELCTHNSAKIAIMNLLFRTGTAISETTLSSIILGTFKSWQL